MEVFYLANQGQYPFRSGRDFKDSRNEKEPDDEAIIEAATRAVGELNERYGREDGGIFFFFHRHRQWAPSQESWMGWDRKRGALVEFTSLLRGNENTSFSTQVGDLSVLPKIKYVITLDADTNLPRDVAKRLVGTLAHPLNRPIVDKTLNRVVKGCGGLAAQDRRFSGQRQPFFICTDLFGTDGVDPYHRGLRCISGPFVRESSQVKGL